MHRSTRVVTTLASVTMGKSAYKIAWAITIAAILLLVWLSLGVGIIGKDGDPANSMYFGVVAIWIVGTLIARFRSTGMARVLLAMAIAQGAIAAIALFAGMGRPWSGPLELILLNGFFIGLFFISAWLFSRSPHAARI